MLPQAGEGQGGHTWGSCTHSDAIPSSAHGDRGQQEFVTHWSMLTLVGVTPSACTGKGWCVGIESAMAALPSA